MSGQGANVQHSNSTQLVNACSQRSQAAAVRFITRRHDKTRSRRLYISFQHPCRLPSIIPLYLPITKLERCWRPEACTAMLLETLISSTALTLLVESRVTERSRTHRKLRHLSSVASGVEDRRNRTCIRSDVPCQQELSMGSNRPASQQTATATLKSSFMLDQ